MITYSQVSKQVSWALFGVTIFLAGFATIAVGFASALVVFLQYFTESAKPWRLPPAAWAAPAILGPAIFLIRFYFVIAAREYSQRYALAGWTASAVYHAALTGLFIFYLPGSIQPSGSAAPIPFSVVTGAACCVSLFLVLRYPRAPQMS